LLNDSALEALYSLTTELKLSRAVLQYPGCDMQFASRCLEGAGQVFPFLFSCCKLGMGSRC
jgi:hypothetical protein